jgi:hypothetical protein
MNPGLAAWLTILVFAIGVYIWLSLTIWRSGQTTPSQDDVDGESDSPIFK